MKAQSLLRTNVPVDDVLSLPFIADVAGSDERSFWCPAKAFPESTPQEQGTLCAAAYLERQQQLGPSDGCLVLIVKHMPQEQTLAEIYFFRFLELCAHPAISGHRRLFFAQYARELAANEREGVKLIPPTATDDGPGYAEVLALCTALGCTVRDLVVGDEAYIGATP